MRTKLNARSFKASLLKIQPVNIVFIVMLIFFSIAAPNFLSMENALSLARQGALLMILCMGVIVVKITGGMDLATGAIMTLAGMIGLDHGLNEYFAAIACLLAVLTAVFLVFLMDFRFSYENSIFYFYLGHTRDAIGLALGLNKEM
jgi:predicted ABC-type sugar transport system permease subunit